MFWQAPENPSSILTYIPFHMPQQSEAWCTQWMVCIRPNIAYVVGVVSRFMSNPSKDHAHKMFWQAPKNPSSILTYIPFHMPPQSEAWCTQWMVCIRPNIAYVVEVVSQFMSNPSKDHAHKMFWQAPENPSSILTYIPFHMPQQSKAWCTQWCALGRTSPMLSEWSVGSWATLARIIGLRSSEYSDTWEASQVYALKDNGIWEAPQVYALKTMERG